MQKITINNIKVFGHHGVYEYENEGQYFYVTIVYAYDYGDNYADKLNEVVDYTSVVDYLHTTFDEIRFNLMESLIDYLIEEFKAKPDLCIKWCAIIPFTNLLSF